MRSPKVFSIRFFNVSDNRSLFRFDVSFLNFRDILELRRIALALRRFNYLRSKNL